MTNEIVALQEIFQGAGNASQIYAAEFYDLPGTSVRTWRSFDGHTEDLLLVHYSHGSPVFEQVFRSALRKILVYHNVTPGRYLAGLDPPLREKSEQALDALASYAPHVEAAIAHSEFSAQDLRQAGYRRIEVLPFTLHERLYEVPPDENILLRYRSDGWRTLLVAGRIIPHKRIEDALFVLDYLKRFVDPRWRLVVVGSWEGSEVYRERLMRLIASLGLSDVIWTGLVPQAALLAYFKIADALLFPSEHEGFGVPLVEAMRMDVPIVACDSGAVEEVLGGAGVLFHNREWPVMAEAVALIVSDHSARDAVLCAQRERREFFSRAMAERRWQDFLRSLTERPAPARSASPPTRSAAEARTP